MTPIDIAITNFRKVRSADFACAPITLLAANNAQGKSSIALGVAAALTGDAIPDVFELKKGEVKELIRDGQKSAMIRLKSVDGEAELTYPECRTSTVGTPPRASVFAAGLRSICTIPRNERGAALAPYMGAEPTEADLAAALPEFNPELLKKCWEAIQKNGWDKVHQTTEGRRLAARAQWEQVTGEKFGSAKAKTWRPAGWADDMFGEVSIEMREENVAEARALLEEAIGAGAVQATDIASLKLLAEQANARVDDVVAKTDAVETLEAEVKDKQAQSDTLGPTGHYSGIPCPHCGEKVVYRIVGGAPQLLKAGSTEDDIKATRQKRAEIDGALANAKDRLTVARRELDAAVALSQQSEAAVQKLSEMPPEGTDKGAEISIERARDALTKAEAELEMAKKFEGATTAYQAWDAANQFVVVLSDGPDGLRSKQLAKATAAYNRDVLAPLCEAAGWGAVEITDDFRVVYNGRPYALGAASDKLRCRATFQVAMAKHDGSSMVVIDEAEVLDNAGKRGLCNLLELSEMPGLICMVTGNPTQGVPDLSKFQNLGITLWVEEGGLKALPDAIAEFHAAREARRLAAQAAQ